jgi:hypothetical protein
MEFGLERALLPPLDRRRACQQECLHRSDNIHSIGFVVDRFSRPPLECTRYGTPRRHMDRQSYRKILKKEEGGRTIEVEHEASWRFLAWAGKFTTRRVTPSNRVRSRTQIPALRVPGA